MILCVNQGALVGKTKQRVFLIPCEMQYDLGLLCPDYPKERNKQERGDNKKKMALTWKAGLSPKQLLPPLDRIAPKLVKKAIERTIEIMTYCFK